MGNEVNQNGKEATIVESVFMDLYVKSLAGIEISDEEKEKAKKRFRELLKS